MLCTREPDVREAENPRVKRCKAHQIVDCFDCKNPVQTTQENPEFECVEVPNGHE